MQSERQNASSRNWFPVYYIAVSKVHWEWGITQPVNNSIAAHLKATSVTAPLTGLHTKPHSQLGIIKGPKSSAEFPAFFQDTVALADRCVYPKLGGLEQ